eukprot:XP_025983847.1 F-box/kelch-repeat protein SKIP4 [Glycine max]
MRYWKLVDDLPPHISKREGMGFEAVGNKLFLLGGCSEFLDSTDEVYSYDASSNCCAQASSLSTARLVSLFLFFLEANSTDPKIVNEIKDSVILDGKIYIRCSRYPVTPHVFAVVYEPSSGTWEYADKDIVSGWTGPAVAVDDRKGMGFEALGSKLFLLGGCSGFLDFTDEAYSYDASSNCWAVAASLSNARYISLSIILLESQVSKCWRRLYYIMDHITPFNSVKGPSFSNGNVESTVFFYFYKTFRCYLTCEVLDEKLYAIGGLVSNSSNHSWDTFDPLTNCWTFHIDPNIGSDIKDSVVLDGKIYVRCARHPDVTRRVFVVVYEPSSGTWQYADADMVSGWTGPAVVVDGTLYVLDKSLGTSLMMWHKDQVGKLSPWLTRPSCQLVAVGKSIFIVGINLSTVVVDVGDLGNEGQVMMGSSIPGLLSDFNVISCKCLSI